MGDEQETQLCVHLTPREHVENTFMIVYNRKDCGHSEIPQKTVMV